MDLLVQADLLVQGGNFVLEILQVLQSLEIQVDVLGGEWGNFFLEILQVLHFHFVPFLLLLLL